MGGADLAVERAAHTVRVRATDSAGNTQPDTVPFNQQGYLYGGIVAHPITVI